MTHGHRIRPIDDEAFVDGVEGQPHQEEHSSPAVPEEPDRSGSSWRKGPVDHPSGDRQGYDGNCIGPVQDSLKEGVSFNLSYG